jgi:hypothetical protein
MEELNGYCLYRVGMKLANLNLALDQNPRTIELWRIDP